MITVPPQMRAAGVDEMPYRKVAQQCYARMMMSRGQLNMFSQRFRLENGVEITCSYCWGKQDVWINIPEVAAPSKKVVSVFTLHGFLTHPRNGLVRGFQFTGHDSARTPTYGIAHTGKGYKQENYTLTDLGDETGVQTGIPYPLADDRNTVYHFEYVSEEWRAAGPQELVYGNVDWKGPATDNPADRKILTYKGNPSRYWPVGNFVEIPGLSSVDHSVDGLLNSYEHMTVFGDKIYEGGKVLVEMPWLYHPLNSVDGGWEANHQNAHVLGAAYRESDGVLFCIVKTCYNGYPTVKPVPTGAVPDPGYVSAWHTYKDGVVYKDWLDDREGAEKQVTDSKDTLTIVEVPDPGRGYFVELIMSKAGDIPGGWKRLLRISTGSNWCDVNWFFSADGTKACSVMFGKLHKIVISGDSATHTEESLGGFKNTVKTVSTTVQESNPGEPDPEQSGIFGDVYRIGVDVGDWINKTDTTKTHTSVKSGTTILAADYRGNVLITMQETISGSDTFTARRREGTRWGNIAIADDTDGRFLPDKRVPSIMVASYDFGVACAYFTGACKPIVTIGDTSSSDIHSAILCAPFPCSFGGTTVTATITDQVTGLSATATRTFDTPGHWGPQKGYRQITDFEYSCVNAGCEGYYQQIIGGVLWHQTVARGWSEDCHTQSIPLKVDMSWCPLSFNTMYFVQSEYYQEWVCDT